MTTHANEKQRGWLLAGQKKNEIAPGLYLVATPIGNLGDITIRALDVLAGVDLVVCEDTRVSGKLLHAFGIDKPLLPYNDHNAEQQRGPILKRLLAQEKIALVSDAGTPLVSDPGYKLVRACAEMKIPVTALPGANAVLTALQLSALPTDAFCFGGFLPAKSAARRKALAVWKDTRASFIFFETAPRLVESLADILETLGDREIAIARELTKLFEEVRRMKISEAFEVYKKEGPPKGEIVLVIAGAGDNDMDEDEIKARLKRALKTMSKKEAAAELAEVSGRSKKELYEMTLKF